MVALSFLRSLRLAIAGVRHLPPLVDDAVRLLVDGADRAPGPGEPWPPFEGPLVMIPQGRRSLYEVYGDPGVTYARDGEVQVSRAWERRSLLVARGLPGYDRPLYVHRLVEPYLREALRRAALVGGYEIEHMGAFSPRHQRHDPRRPLSDHTWAAAVDVDPARNQPHTRGTIPEAWAQAWESVGFEWGGRWKSFPDPMHFQLRRT